MLVDSHCHLDRIDLQPFNNSLDEALDCARNQGVEHFLCVAIDQQNQAEVFAIADAYNDVSASVGIHPLYTEGQQADLDYLCTQARHPKVVAIGETGLDYYYSSQTKAQQQNMFTTHVAAAVKLNLPLIIHSRDARQDTLDILAQGGAEKVAGVLHCFTESLQMAQAAIEMGFYVSFSGILTFKNAQELRKVAKQLPLERLLVETDSPYLTPVPYRGKPNSPRHVVEVAKCLAELKAVSYAEICQQTTENFKRLFLQGV